jgi:hypothetical protein
MLPLPYRDGGAGQHGHGTSHTIIMLEPRSIQSEDLAGFRGPVLVIPGGNCNSDKQATITRFAANLSSDIYRAPAKIE